MRLENDSPRTFAARSLERVTQMSDLERPRVSGPEPGRMMIVRPAASVKDGRRRPANHHPTRLRPRYAWTFQIAHLSDALKRACCKCARRIIFETHERPAEPRIDASDVKRVRRQWI